MTQSDGLYSYPVQLHFDGPSTEYDLDKNNSQVCPFEQRKFIGTPRVVVHVNLNYMQRLRTGRKIGTNGIYSK